MAAIIDALIVGVVSFLLMLVLTSIKLGFLGMIIQLGLGIGYYVFYQQSQTQTIGKKIMNIKVVDVSGKTPTLMTFFLREIIGKMISGIILGIGYLMIAFDAKKQGLHDKIASTFVIKV